jgi:hypothetical protein
VTRRRDGEARQISEGRWLLSSVPASMAGSAAGRAGKSEQGGRGMERANEEVESERLGVEHGVDTASSSGAAPAGRP